MSLSRSLAAACLAGLALPAAPAQAQTPPDLRITLGGGASRGKTECVAAFACDHGDRYVKGTLAWRAWDALDLQLSGFGGATFKGGDTTDRGTDFGGDFKVSGVGLLGVVMGLGFTGYLLPWDQKAYWATVVGTKVPEVIPVVGDLSKVILRGGDSMGALTLTRFYAIHMLMLPSALMAFMGIHLYLVVRIGITPLPEKLDEAYDRVKAGL